MSVSQPSVKPTKRPATYKPSKQPSLLPTRYITYTPTLKPSLQASISPTAAPSRDFTSIPTNEPSFKNVVALSKKSNSTDVTAVVVGVVLSLSICILMGICVIYRKKLRSIYNEWSDLFVTDSNYSSLTHGDVVSSPIHQGDMYNIDHMENASGNGTKSIIVDTSYSKKSAIDTDNTSYTIENKSVVINPLHGITANIASSATAMTTSSGEQSQSLIISELMGSGNDVRKNIIGNNNSHNNDDDKNDVYNPLLVVHDDSRKLLDNTPVISTSNSDIVRKECAGTNDTVCLRKTENIEGKTGSAASCLLIEATIDYHQSPPSPPVFILDDKHPDVSNNNNSYDFAGTETDGVFDCEKPNNDDVVADHIINIRTAKPTDTDYLQPFASNVTSIDNFSSDSNKIDDGDEDNYDDNTTNNNNNNKNNEGNVIEVEGTTQKENIKVEINDAEPIISSGIARKDVFENDDVIISSSTTNVVLLPSSSESSLLSLTYNDEDDDDIRASLFAKSVIGTEINEQRLVNRNNITIHTSTTFDVTTVPANHTNDYKAFDNKIASTGALTVSANYINTSDNDENDCDNNNASNHNNNNNNSSLQSSPSFIRYNNSFSVRGCNSSKDDNDEEKSEFLLHTPILSLHSEGSFESNSNNNNNNSNNNNNDSSKDESGNSNDSNMSLNNSVTDANNTIFNDNHNGNNTDGVFTSNENKMNINDVQITNQLLLSKNKIESIVDEIEGVSEGEGSRSNKIIPSPSSSSSTFVNELPHHHHHRSHHQSKIPVPIVKGNSSNHTFVRSRQQQQQQSELASFSSSTSSSFLSAATSSVRSANSSPMRYSNNNTNNSNQSENITMKRSITDESGGDDINEINSSSNTQVLTRSASSDQIYSNFNSNNSSTTRNGKGNVDTKKLNKSISLNSNTNTSTTTHTRGTQSNRIPPIMTLNQYVAHHSKLVRANNNNSSNRSSYSTSGAVAAVVDDDARSVTSVSSVRSMASSIGSVRSTTSSTLSGTKSFNPIGSGSGCQGSSSSMHSVTSHSSSGSSYSTSSSANKLRSPTSNSTTNKKSRDIPNSHSSVHSFTHSSSSPSITRDVNKRSIVDVEQPPVRDRWPENIQGDKRDRWNAGRSLAEARAIYTVTGVGTTGGGVTAVITSSPVVAQPVAVVPIPTLVTISTESLSPNSSTTTTTEAVMAIAAVVQSTTSPLPTVMADDVVSAEDEKDKGVKEDKDHNFLP